MEEPRGLFRHMFNLQRVFFECVRIRLGNDMSIHPKQGPIMGILLKNEGLSQADLVRELGVTAATVAVSISRLERLGYVRRERNEKNQRANVLSLTETVLMEVRDAALKGFDDAELDQIMAYCGRMTRNLRTRYQQGEEKGQVCGKC